MKVREVMTPNPKAIWLTESLSDAAQLMWENDCGVLPIIKDGQRVIGLITDRDICMGAAIKDRNPSSISVEEVMTGEVYAVDADDTIAQALVAMKEHKVRRLPVINPVGELEGILSMNDILRHAKLSVGEEDSIDQSDVVETYASICERREPDSKVAGASG